MPSTLITAQVIPASTDRTLPSVVAVARGMPVTKSRPGTEHSSPSGSLISRVAIAAPTERSMMTDQCNRNARTTSSGPGPAVSTAVLVTLQSFHTCLTGSTEVPLVGALHGRLGSTPAACDFQFGVPPALNPGTRCDREREQAKTDGALCLLSSYGREPASEEEPPGGTRSTALASPARRSGTVEARRLPSVSV